MTRCRNGSGNMLTLVALTMGLVVGLTMLGFTLNSFLFQCRRSQSSTDAMALHLASKINLGDRIGQMNELQQCSRELLYIGEQELNKCAEEEFDFLAPLCGRLVDEARTGHMLLERERENQVQQIVGEIQDFALQYNTDRTGAGALLLPWFQTREPTIVRIDLGYIENVESNVRSSDGMEELAEFDQQSGYVDRSTRLFKANREMTLPGRGSEFRFYMSSLPAFVGRTSPPARNTNSDVFVRTATIFADGEVASDSITQLPSAVQVFCSMDTSFDLMQKHERQVNLVSTATTNGATAGSE